MFNTITGQEKTFLQTGRQASHQLQDLFGFGAKNKLNQGYQDFKFNPRDLSKMPGYQFQLQQGDRALQSSDATTVGALSGAAMKDLMKFNQGLAGTYENQYYNQQLSNYQTNQGNFYAKQNNIFNRLSSLAQMGQNAAGNLGGNAAQLGTGIAQAQAAAGASQAAGQVGSANAYSNAVGNIPLYALLSGSNGSNAGTASGPGEGPPNG